MAIFDNPIANALASLEQVTPEDILAQVTQALGEGKTLGLAIYHMRAGDPTPETRSIGHAKACKCDECERCRYAGGWG